MFGLGFFVLIILFWELRDNGVVKKFAILTLKPRSHVRILIYRTWAIREKIRMNTTRKTVEHLQENEKIIM